MISIFNRLRESGFIPRMITAISISAVFWIALYAFPPWGFSALLRIMLLEILIFEWPLLFSPRSWQFWLIMPLYPIFPFFLLITLHHYPVYRAMLIAIWMLVSVFDTLSYIGGVLLGRHAIAPSVTPHKTWEGFMVGMVSVFITLVGLCWYYASPMSYPLMGVVTLVVSVLAFLGDLFESWLKRRAGIKDTGALLPGHGGLLDRLDGILFVVLFVYFFRDYLTAWLGI